MAVNPNRTTVTPIRANAGAKQSDDREPTQIWLNVGYTHTDSQTGEDVFVSLPMGLPVDTMKPAKVTGSNEEYRKLTEAKNALLALLVDAGGQMGEGEVTMIDDLQLQLRRVASAEPVAREQNQFMGSLSQLSFARRA